MDFILATTNRGKAIEVLELLGVQHTVRTLADVGFCEEIAEYGVTFAENAAIKAKAVREVVTSGFDYILADDSGLVIDALDGKPGVYSARWLGTDTPYDVKNQMVIEMLKDVPEVKRTARFVCAMACINIENQMLSAEGVLEGRIATEPAGNNGFGYDPIFYLPGKGCTLAQLGLEEKNCISHRSLAFRNLHELCKGLI